MPVRLPQRMAAEFLGTGVLVFAGCGAIVVAQERPGSITTEGIAACFGLVVMAMIYATGHLSGAHLNPGVTLGFALFRHFEVKDVAPYWLAQFGGAIAAALLLRLIFGDEMALGTTMPSSSAMQSFALEVVITAVLMFVIVSVATDSRALGQAAAIAIGGTVALMALFAGPISGASMNAARSLGPALVAWELDDLWIYLVSTPLGAGLGAFAYTLIRGDR